MASEDSGRPVEPSVPPPAVHGDGEVEEPLESRSGEMLPVLHRRDDGGEGLELEALLAEDGMGSKERDDLVPKVFASPYHVDERSVSTTCSCVAPDPAAAESGLQELEDRGSFGVLADMELWG
jgi:hypothetical protein